MEGKIEMDVSVSRTYKNSFCIKKEQECLISFSGCHFLRRTVHPEPTFSAINSFALQELLEPH